MTICPTCRREIAHGDITILLGYLRIHPECWERGKSEYIAELRAKQQKLSAQ